MKFKKNYIFPIVFTTLILVFGYPMLINDNGIVKASLIALLGVSFVWIFHFGVGTALKSAASESVAEEKEKESKDFI